VNHAVEVDSGGMIYIQHFMMIGRDFEAIFRLCLRNLRVCNVDITDERDLRITALRWAQMH
jgi:hypothetical protein